MPWKDDDEIDEDGTTLHRKSTNPLGTDEYINRVTGHSANSSRSNSDNEIAPTIWKRDNKAKRKKVEDSGESDHWSSQEETIYEANKNRKATKRAKTLATKKKLKEKAKQVAAKHKSAKKNGESAKEKQERLWGDVEDYAELMEEEIPEYLKERKREFDREYQELHENGLRLPPSYEDVEFSDDERLADLEERPCFDASVEVSREYEDVVMEKSGGVIPASIAQYLRDYQIDGVKFLHEMFVYQKGGILGDDMGLGKTVQVAAFLTAAFGKTGDERDGKRMRKMRRSPQRPWYPRVLIVCPGSLIQNWKNELERWGWWHIGKYHMNEREDALQTAASGRLEVLITTYSTYRNDKDKLNEIAWDCVVADECHQLKDPTSATTQAMNEVNALCRIGLTGTAIQNKYEELWTLLNWTNPGRFGPISTWVSSISQPLRMGQSHDATYHQLKRARATATKLVENLLPQFFLRRMKSLIAHQLPRKTDKVVFCPLTDTQRDAYENFLNSENVQLVKNASEPCDCESGLKSGWCCYATLPESNTNWRAMVFPYMATLQKLSNHLALLIPSNLDPSDKQQKDLDYLQTMVPGRWKELYEHRDSLYNLSNPEFCGKWKILKNLLSFWHENGDKVLIFSHSVRLLRLLEHLFQNTSYNASFLSGSMPNEDRQTTVDNFNSDPNQFVFLISTKAGGVGLNITSANKVVIFDPNWNPSYDLQAQDRAYRIGQQRDVEVYRLVSAGTIEEIVYARQIYKQQQANIGYNASTERRYFKGIQNVKDQKGEIFGLDNLLTFHGDDIVLRDIVNKTNVAEAKRGIDVLEVNMDDLLNDEDNPLVSENDAKGDAAMSQLAAMLTEGEAGSKIKRAKPKHDPVAAILSSAGVEYTHENSEVVGSSKVEAELSRRAEEAGNDVQYGEEKLFAESQSASTADGKMKYVFHPPEEVMKRQFCTMAKMFGFESATEFAFVVEGWTQKQRTDCLERFYLKRREKMTVLNASTEGGVSHDTLADATEKETTKDAEGDVTMDLLDNLIDGMSDAEEKSKPELQKEAPLPVVAEEDISTEDDDDEL